MMLTCTLFHLRNRENTFYLGHESPQHVPTPMEDPKLNICLESHLPCYVSPFTLLFKVPKETDGRSADIKHQGIVRQKGLRKGNVIILQRESGHLQKGWLAGTIRGGHLFIKKRDPTREGSVHISEAAPSFCSSQLFFPTPFFSLLIQTLFGKFHLSP